MEQIINWQRRCSLKIILPLTLHIEDLCLLPFSNTNKINKKHKIKNQTSNNPKTEVLNITDVTSSAKPKVTVGGWGTINCSHCGKKNVGGIIAMWIDDIPCQAEICNLCLKKHYEEVK